MESYVFLQKYFIDCVKVISGLLSAGTNIIMIKLDKVFANSAPAS